MSLPKALIVPAHCYERFSSLWDMGDKNFVVSQIGTQSYLQGGISAILPLASLSLVVHCKYILVLFTSCSLNPVPPPDLVESVRCKVTARKCKTVLSIFLKGSAVSSGCCSVESYCLALEPLRVKGTWSLFMSSPGVFFFSWIFS